MGVYNPGSAFTIGEWAFGEFHGDKVHVGIDFLAPSRTPVPAAANGVVLGVGYEVEYGNMVIIRHTAAEDGPPYRYTLYAHLVEWPPVQHYQEVLRGQTIGNVGMSGTGGHGVNHLHFELISLEEDKWLGGSAANTWFANSEKKNPLYLDGEEGRVDPLDPRNWTWLDVYEPPPCDRVGEPC